MNKFGEKLDGHFKISERGSRFSTEIIAGITTFLAMAYILVVNPSTITGDISGVPNPAGPLWNSVFIATVFGALIGTLLLAFLANVPYAQAPGMGLNSQTALVLVGFAGAGGYLFGGVLAIILISGALFLLLTVIPCGRDKETGAMITVREKIFDGIPAGIRAAIPVGIGLFIAFIGLQNAGIVKAQDGIKVDLVNFTTMFTAWDSAEGVLARGAVVFLLGLVAIAILSKFRVKGAVLIGILIATILGIPFGITNVKLLGDASEWKFWEKFADFFSRDPEKGTFFMFDFANAFRSEAVLSTIMLVITFCMIDMFDTIGTLVGCATKANLLDKNGKPIGFKRAMFADSIATVAGACLGTSTVTTFVESGTGVAEGGKTGFASIITALLFLLSVFILPVFKVIPSAAAACGLVYVGVLMMSTVTSIDFTDVRIAVPAFLTIAGMPFFYSITDGIGIGLVSYVLINIICYGIDWIVYAARSKKAAPAATPATEENAETSEDAPVQSAETVIEKPKWTISVITGVIAVLFLVMYLVPLAVG
ncbi:MAG: NCS2 family permease [Clostridia bacterium]|jgi:AGZA family xanthine/uracil permease-like MFS transporter|nr:NCS2 family permease [Clostridia bacterium]